MGALVILEQRLFRPQHAKAVAPAQRQLQHAPRLRVGGDLLIHRRDARIGERRGHGQMLEEDQRNGSDCDGGGERVSG